MRAVGAIVGAGLLLCACGLQDGGSAPSPDRTASPNPPLPGNEPGRASPDRDRDASAVPTKYVSFVPQTKPGDAPALVSFHNLTALRMTLWLNEIIFFAIAPGATVGPEPGPSADVKADTSVGEHQEDSGLCVNFRLSEYEGPAALAPATSYAFDLTFLSRAKGYRAVVSEVQSAEPFVAVRAEVHDPKATSRQPSTLTMQIGDDGAPLAFETYDANRSTYRFARTTAHSAQRLAFVDGSGARFESAQVVALDGASGYTAVVDDKPVPGMGVAALSAVKE